MKITVLTLDEKPRLEWRKALTEYYQKTGDWTVYRLRSLDFPVLEK